MPALFIKERFMGWEEKRKYKRAYIKLSVEYRGKSFWQVVEAQDLSAGGMFIVTDKVEPPQTQIDIMFSFGEGDKKFIHAQGVVAWSRPKPKDDGNGNIEPAGMGIMFTKFLPSRSQGFIDEVIKKMGEEKDG
ncbi:MAG: PilZ domain-containing protein [Candidatus Omnitrophota bacterium]